MFRKLLLAFGLIAAGTACAQTAAPTPTLPAPQPSPTAAAAVDADPALWVVRDKDTTIYLFGTVHLLKPGLSWFDEGVKKAFDSSDELVLEMVQPDTPTMQSLVEKKHEHAHTQWHGDQRFFKAGIQRQGYGRNPASYGKRSNPR